ncbi:MAG TPA: hypothetical protein VG603_06990 [Chitinophagales bacterium]|nr:hypothetical protein [Chitinophagales bacterium]
MKELLLSNWHFMRVFRLLFALACLWSWFSTKDSMMLLGGIFFGYQAVLNVGCAGGSCAAGPVRSKQFDDKNTEDITFEEVKRK